MSTTYYKMINVFGIQLRYPENLTKRKKEKKELRKKKTDRE